MIAYGKPFRERLASIGARAQKLRLLRELPQNEVASRAGVGVATVQRFERTGIASFENVLRIAAALEADAGFERLFEAPRYRTLDEALAEPEVKARKRAPRSK